MNEKEIAESNKEKILEEFRNAWKQEVKRKHEKTEHIKESSGSVEKEDTTTEKSIGDMVERTESLTTNDQAAPVTALDHYVIAVDNERQGKLGKG